jgi:mono/diheme cytochrome c family protein
MKKFLKLAVIVIGIIVVIIAGLLMYVKVALPGANVAAASDVKFEYTPERVARGKYLANNVTMCIDCHSKRDYSKFGAPMVPGTVGQGGELFGRDLGFPGNFYAPNITPYGIGQWTDGEVMRAITTGVSRDGHALFPIMPYPNFGQLDKEDIYSIIAYVRSLEPIKNDVQKSVADFPVNFIINTIPKEASFTVTPPKKELVAYGKYMFTAVGCNECHTPREQGKPIEGKFLAGGFEFPFPDGTVVRSLNITPHKETGIGTWTEGQFVARFKQYSDSTYTPHPVQNGDFKTVMPWLFYTHMKEEDLKAIFAYLQTVPPIENKVNRFEKLLSEK